MQHVKPPRLDVEPTIALANADDWMRRYKILRRKPFAHDVMKQARIERSAYQGELIVRFARFVIAQARFWREALFSQPASSVKPRRE